MGEQNGSEVIKNWPKEPRESRNIDPKMKPARSS